jgi:predicted transcriptional regulator YdeE
MKNLLIKLYILGMLPCGIVSAQNTIDNDQTKETYMEKYTVIQKPSVIIVGIDCRTSNSPEAAPVDIPKLWGRFMTEDIYNKIPNKNSNEVFALYCDYEGDYTQPYTLVIGYSVSSIEEVPDGMVTKVIPTGTYALYRAIGEHPQSLIKTWEHIWKEDDLKRTYTGDYELYGEKFMTGTPKEVEVLIAIDG